MSNQPLIFVDGVRQAAESYPLNASNANFPHYGPSSQMSQKPPAKTPKLSNTALMSSPPGYSSPSSSGRF